MSFANNCYYDDEGIDVQFKISSNEFEFDDTTIGGTFFDNEARMDEIIETFNLLDKVDDIDRFLETFESDELTSNQQQINKYGDNNDDGNVYGQINNYKIGDYTSNSKMIRSNHDNLSSNINNKIITTDNNKDYINDNDQDDDEVQSDGATIDENSICSVDWINSPSMANIITDVNMCVDEDSSESGMDVCSSNWDDFESEHELASTNASVTCKQRAYEMAQHLNNKVQCQQQQQKVNAIKSNTNSNYSDIKNKHYQSRSCNKIVNTSSSNNNKDLANATIHNEVAITATITNNNNMGNLSRYRCASDASSNGNNRNGYYNANGNNSTKDFSTINNAHEVIHKPIQQTKLNDAKITSALPATQHIAVPILTFTLPCFMEPKLWGPTQTLVIKRFRYQNSANDKYFTTIYNNEPNPSSLPTPKTTASMWKASKSTQIPENHINIHQTKHQCYKLTDTVLWQKEIFVLDRKCFNNECVIEATLLLWHKHLNGIIDPQALELIDRDHVETFLYIVDVERLDNIDVRNRSRLWRRRLLENLFLPTSNVQLIPQTTCMSFEDLNQQCYQMQQIYPITGVVLKNDAHLTNTSTTTTATATETLPLSATTISNNFVNKRRVI